MRGDKGGCEVNGLSVHHEQTILVIFKLTMEVSL
jgi:hypothetical protein